MNKFMKYAVIPMAVVGLAHSGHALDHNLTNYFDARNYLVRGVGEISQENTGEQMWYWNHRLGKWMEDVMHRRRSDVEKAMLQTCSEYRPGYKLALMLHGDGD